MKKKLTFLVIIIAVGAIGIYIGSAWIARRVNKEIAESFKKVNDSLDSSNAKINSADYLYTKIRLTATPEELTKMDLLKAAVDAYKSYIDSISQAFKTTMKSGTEMGPTNQFFETEKNGTLLLSRTRKMEKVFILVSSNDSLKNEIRSMSIPVMDDNPVKDGAAFVKFHFHDMPGIAAVTMLAHFKNIAVNCEMAILKDYSNLATLRITK